MTQSWSVWFRRVLSVSVPLLLVFAILYLAWFMVHGASGYFQSLVLHNYVFFFGLPIAALFAYMLVVSLESTHGPVEIEFMSLKFKGAAGPIVFWLLCFLALVLGFKLFWVGAPISAA